MLPIKERAKRKRAISEIYTIAPLPKPKVRAKVYSMQAGLDYYYGGNLKLAFEHLSAFPRDPQALFLIGEIYMHDCQILKQKDFDKDKLALYEPIKCPSLNADYYESKTWNCYNHSASLNYIPAMWKVYDFMKDGEVKDMYLKRIASLGDGSAYLIMGLKWRKKYNNIEDVKKAYDLFQKAVSNGCTRAYFYLGEILIHNKLGTSPVDQYWKKALEYFILAYPECESQSRAYIKMILNSKPECTKDIKIVQLLLKTLL